MRVSIARMATRGKIRGMSAAQKSPNESTHIGQSTETRNQSSLRQIRSRCFYCRGVIIKVQQGHSITRQPIRYLIIFQLSRMTEAKITEVMEAIFKNGSKELERIEPMANLKLGTVIENCFKKSGDNPDRFATCVIASQKKMQQSAEIFQFKQLFLNQFVQNCVVKSDAQKCKAEGLTLLTNSVNTFVKSMDSI